MTDNISKMFKTKKSFTIFRIDKQKLKSATIIPATYESLYNDIVERHKVLIFLAITVITEIGDFI